MPRSAPLFVLPALALFGFMVLWPTVQTVMFSFHRYGPEIRTQDFVAAGVIAPGQDKYDVPPAHRAKVAVGAANYADAAEDARLRWSFANNLLYLLATLVVEVGFGGVLAFLVARKTRMAGLFRVLFFAPMVLSLVVTGLLWKSVFNLETGLLPAGLRAAGLDGLVPAEGYLGDPRTALWCICLVSGWAYAGFYMILFYAALTRVPRELLEAARLDGAGEWRLVRSIYLPLLWEVIVVSVLLCATGAFRAYDLFYVMTPRGGPLTAGPAPHKTTEIVSMYMIETGFGDQFGYGCALAVLLAAAVLAASLLLHMLSRLRPRVEY